MTDIIVSRAVKILFLLNQINQKGKSFKITIPPEQVERILRTAYMVSLMLLISCFLISWLVSFSLLLKGVSRKIMLLFSGLMFAIMWALYLSLMGPYGLKIGTIPASVTIVFGGITGWAVGRNRTSNIVKFGVAPFAGGIISLTSFLLFTFVFKKLF